MSSEKINPVEIAPALPLPVTGSLARISGRTGSSTPLQETPSRRAMIPKTLGWRTRRVATRVVLFRVGPTPGPVPRSVPKQTAAAPVVDSIRLILSNGVVAHRGTPSVTPSLHGRPPQCPRDVDA